MASQKVIIAIFLLVIWNFTSGNKSKEDLKISIQSVVKDEKQVSDIIKEIEEYEKAQKAKVQEEKAKGNNPAELALKGITGDFYTGLASMVNGASKKSPREFLSGSFKVASAIVTSFGVYGLLASKILLLMSKTLDIYGDITSPRLNPTKVALENFQISNLELDVAGVTEYFESFVNPIVLEYDIDASSKIKSGTIKTEKVITDKISSYTLSEAKTVIRNAQKHLELYGKLQFLIAKYCKNKIEVVEEDYKTRMNQCMECIKLYVKLSQTHTAFLETSIQRIYHSETIKDQQENFVASIVGFIAKRQQRDNDTLYFLTDPMQFPDKTDVIFELYSKPYDYNDVIEHLIALKPNGKSIFKNDRVVVCREEKLQGLCRDVYLPPPKYRVTKFSSNGIEQKEPIKLLSYDDITLNNWRETKSVFIPPELVLYLGKRAIGGNLVDGLYGLSVFSSSTKLNHQPLHISPNTYFKRSDSIQICTFKENVNEPRWCHAVRQDKTGELSFSDIEGIDLSNSKIDSIKVPKNYNVVLTAADKTTLTVIGPFTAKSLNLCKDYWKTIHITKIELEEPEKTKETTQGSNQSTNKAPEKATKQTSDIKKNSNNPVNIQKQSLSKEELKNLPRGDSLVSVCSEKDGKGFCNQIFGNYFLKKSTNLLSIFKTFKTGCKTKIRSVKIPAGKKVTFEEKYDLGVGVREGPYFGPVTIDKLHDNSKYEFIIEDVDDSTTTAEINTEEKAESGESAIVKDSQGTTSPQSQSNNPSPKPDDKKKPKQENNIKGRKRSFKHAQHH